VIHSRLNMISKQLYEQAKLELYRHFEDQAVGEDISELIASEMASLTLVEFQLGKQPIKSKLPF